MKKIFLIIALILLFIPILISAQTSGWRDKGNYKEQILLKDSLISVCFSEDGTKFYTLHYNKIVYYWDFKTGLLIDSLILPKNLQVVKFSSDCKTIIGCDKITSAFSTSIFFDVNLYIIDLYSKNLITKSNFKLPGSMDCGYVDKHGFVYTYLEFNVMDYNYIDSTLDLAPSFIFETYYSDVYTTDIKTALGGAAKFKVYKDTLIKAFQITALPTYDFVQVDESYNISNYSMKEDFYGSSSLQSHNNKYTNSFSKLTNGKITNIFYNEFKHSSYWEMGHRDGGSSDSGTKIPYLKIFYDKTNNVMFIKIGAGYYCSRPYHKPDSIIIQSNYYLKEIMSKDFQYFIYPNYDTILFHNVITKNFDDTLICPFSPPILCLSPYGRSLLAANESGNIVLFEKTILKGTTATLTTENVSNITLNSVVSGGNIFDEGNSSITARGVCWSTTTNPTIANTKTSDGSGIGIFTSNVTGLNPNTIYYLRAYATNSEGTSYGNQITFSTSISSVSEQVNNKNDYFDFITPNPASDFIYLPETNELIREAAIYSIYGEKVMQLNNSQSNIVDISGLSKGVYFLRINNNSYKFVKI